MINKFLKKKPVKQKLIFVIMLTTIIALLLASLGSVIYELVSYKYKIAEDVAQLTDFIGINSAQALANKDYRSAQDTLGTLVGKESIRLASLYDESGRVIAQYSHGEAKGLGLLSEGLYHLDNRIHAYKRVMLDGQYLGTIYLQSDLQGLISRLWLFVRFAFVVMLSVFLVALQISEKLQGYISKPILHLVDVAMRVTKSQNYSLRAIKQSQDEVGDLTEAFNQMLKQIEETEKALIFGNFHDKLTLLPNRTLLLDRLTQMIERTNRIPNYKFAVLYLDLDRFKLINDSLGHLEGDKLLKDFSARLKKSVRKIDTVARIGGDEFVILLDHIKHVRNTITVADRIQEDAKVPYNLNGQEVYTTVSMGIIYNKEGYNLPEQYLRDADNAMHKAKASGKAQYQLFDMGMHSKAVKVLALEGELRRAIEKKEFVLHYQPIYSADNLEVLRLEALVRWQRSDGTLVPPLDFIPLAEETGLILPIGQFVFESVCCQIKKWKEEFDVDVPVAVNFSAKQFEQKDVLEFIQKTITRKGVQASSLEIEITENVIMRDTDYTIYIMNELKKIGFQIAIDDFGTGYSSLSLLRQFPIDRIKIDRTFVKSLTQHNPDVAISKAIVQMSHSLNFDVVAEGVETKEQLEILKKIECNEIQGFLLNAPMKVNDVTKLLCPKI